MMYMLRGRTASTLDRAVLMGLARTDGATVMDSTGRLLAIGAILLHPEPPEPHSTLAVEGARTTAAMAAGRMGAVLKVSEDGLITFYDQQERILGYLRLASQLPSSLPAKTIPWFAGRSPFGHGCWCPSRTLAQSAPTEQDVCARNQRSGIEAWTPESGTVLAGSGGAVKLKAGIPFDSATTPTLNMCSGF